jgi:hypothetical protein
MNSHTKSRHIRRGHVASTANANHRIASNACCVQLRRRQRNASAPVPSSLVTYHRSPSLIGSAAIRNARNSFAIRAKCIDNRSKIVCLRARFSHVLHARNPRPYRTADACRIASRQLLEIHLTRSQQTRKLFLIAGLSGLLAHSWHLAAHQSYVATHASRIHKSRVTNLNSRYNRAFLRAAAQSNQKPRSAAGLRHPARHETGFGLRSSNIAALILRTTKDNA